MSEKISGYLLLIAGVVVIVLALLNGYGIFSSTLAPVQFIKLSSISLDLGVAGKQNLMSGADLSSSTNFFLHLIMLGFFVSVGSKLATLGVQLLRPIKIEVKDGKIVSQ